MVGIHWNLRLTLGTWPLSVVENCPLLGDWSIFLSKLLICIILNAVLHVLKLNSYGRSHKFLCSPYHYYDQLINSLCRIVDKIKLLVVHTSISVPFVVTLFITLNTFIKWSFKN